MATTYKSSTLTNLGAPESLVPPNNSAHPLERIDSVIISDNTINDVYLLCPIESNKVLTSLKIFNDEIDSSTGLTVDIGLSNGPDPFFDNGTYYAAFAPISATLFASAVTTYRAANNGGVEVITGAVSSSVSEMLNAVWKRAGLSADPTKTLVVSFKLHAIATGAETNPVVVAKAVMLGAN